MLETSKAVDHWSSRGQSILNDQLTVVLIYIFAVWPAYGVLMFRFVAAPPCYSWSRGRRTWPGPRRPSRPMCASSSAPPRDR